MNPIGQVIDLVLFLFIIVLFARFVMDWVQVFARDWTPKGPALVVLEIIYSITDPPIRAVRKVLPPIRLGSMALDLAPLIVLIVCVLLRAVNRAVFAAA
ncbi:MAG: YggT family protein [Nocardioidaceae bacterium]|nr:YggT family protein [Nocardioidaceae bacterium]